MNAPGSPPTNDTSDGDSHSIPADPGVIDRQEQRFRALFSDGPAGQAFAHLDGRFAAVNNAFCRIVGRDQTDVVGQTFLEITHPDDQARNRRLVDDLLAGRMFSFQVAKRFVRPDGAAVPVLNTVTIIEAAGERFMAAVSVELREHQQVHDPLRVEIDTRTRTTHEVAHELDQWLRNWPAVLDHLHLKWLWGAVAATGHALVWAVDTNGIMRYLSGAATDLLGSAPEELIGRSIFDVVHPDDLEAARARFERSVATQTGWSGVRVRAMRPDGSACWLETSAIAHIDHDSALIGFTATTRRLDGDEAKTAQAAVTRSRLEQTISGRHLNTLWQPIYSLATGRLVGVEALTRFSHPEISLPPDRWFADAHDAGVGTQLEILAISLALDAARSLPDNVYVSLNVSPSTVASGAVSAAIEQADIHAERLVVELTEHLSIDDYEALVPPLEQLRGRGIRLAVDDAGAGFASFRHILRLRPDIIKLDQSITRGIDANPAQRALAAALVVFALDVGSMTVVAEGVETEAELSTISTLGVDGVQGYYLARPTPVAEIDFEATADHAWNG